MKTTVYEPRKLVKTSSMGRGSARGIVSDPVYDDVWDEPIPFGINDPSGTTSEPFPVDAFPEVPRVMAEAVARTIQVDPALPAMTILGVGSAAIAYKTMVVDGDWTEETSLWSFCVARSGSGSRRRSRACLLRSTPSTGSGARWSGS